MKGPIQSLEVTYLVHATEDEFKVQGAVAHLLQTEAEPAMDRLEGHFGNPIARARVHITGDAASVAFSHVVGAMPPDLKRGVLEGLDSYVDEHSALFLRFDKQQLVSGKVTLGSADPVRLKVKPRAYTMKGAAARFYSKLIGGE